MPWEIQVFWDNNQNKRVREKYEHIVLVSVISKVIN